LGQLESRPASSKAVEDRLARLENRPASSKAIKDRLS